MTGIDLLRASGAIIAEIEAPEGADPEAIDAKLDAWISQVDNKLSAYFWVCRRLDVELEAVKGIRDRALSRMKTLERNQKALRSMARLLLLEREQHGQSAKVIDPEFTAWLVETQAVEVNVDATKLPKKYRRVSVEADRAAIKLELIAGRKVRGCQLVTHRNLSWR